MKRILVTGGAGFIGSNFVRIALQRMGKCRLVNLDKLTYAGNLSSLSDVADDSRYRFVQGDICDSALVETILEKECIDTVVHFAAESHVDRSITDPAEFIRTNVFGTFTLLESTRKVWLSSSQPPVPSPRFLHVSTDEVYGSLGEIGFFTEETPYDPRSPYSASKASSDHLVSAYHHTYGLPTLMTHCSNNYGPYQFPDKLISRMISNALEGKDLPVYEDGKNVRDWLYVVDHCEALLSVLEKGEIGATYNIGGNNEKQNIDVVRAICDILDRKVRPLRGARPRNELIKFVKDRPGHDHRYAIDPTKIKNELGWSPAVTFEMGIEQTIDWYLSHTEWITSVRGGAYREPR